MLKLVDSGVPGLDSALGGGFYRPSTVLVSGDEGVGKTTIVLQSLVFGVRNHERGLYVMPLRETMNVSLSYLERMGFFDKAIMDRGDFTIIELSDVINNPEVDLVEMLVETVKKGEFERVALDDVGQFAAVLGPDYGRFLITLTAALMKQNCMVYLIAADPDPALLSLCDGILRLALAERRTIQIVKMRGNRHTTTPIAMELSEMGIMVLPDSRE